MSRRGRSFQTAHGRREGYTFTRLIHVVQDSENWHKCSGTAIKLLLDLARQYNGRNNGDLTAALGVLKKRGWSSPETVTWAIRELRHYGFLLLTRQGFFPAPNLFALGWLPIDECGGKLDVAASPAGNEWKVAKPKFKRPPRKREANTDVD